MKLINFINDNEPAINAENLNKIQMNVFDNIYPVGSIYMSVTLVYPSEVFGGEWEQIRDTFLLASGYKYGPGDTGGEEAHTLTVGEMPPHDHKVYAKSKLVANGNDTYVAEYSQHGDIYTYYSGDGYAHNNMPPYLVVYVWKRVA